MHGLKKTQETGKNIEKKSLLNMYTYNVYDHFKKNLICQRNQNLMYLLFAGTMPMYKYINFTNH